MFNSFMPYRIKMNSYSTIYCKITLKARLYAAISLKLPAHAYQCGLNKGDEGDEGPLVTLQLILSTLLHAYTPALLTILLQPFLLLSHLCNKPNKLHCIPNQVPTSTSSTLLQYLPGYAIQQSTYDWSPVVIVQQSLVGCVPATCDWLCFSNE